MRSVTKKFKLIAEYPECVIIQKYMGDGYYKTQIRDMEGDIIRSCLKLSQSIPQDFYDTAEKYSLAEIRKIQIEKELKWRREFVEA